MKALLRSIDLIIGFGFIANINVVAQSFCTEQFLKADTCIIFGNNRDPFTRDYTCFNGDSIINRLEQSNDKVTLYSVDLNNYQYYSDTNLNMQFDDMEYIQSIAASNNILAIATNKYIHIFNMSKDSKRIKYVFVKKMNLSNDFRYKDEMCFLPNNNIAILSGYLGIESQKDFLRLSIIDIEKEQVVRSIPLKFILPILSYTEPHKLLAIINNSIFFSQMGEYKIYEYDFNLNLKDSICNNNINWKQYPSEKMDSVLCKYKQTTERIYHTQDISKYNFMFRIYTNDNNELIAFYYDPKRDYIATYDIWSKKNNKWIIKKQDIFDCSNNKKDFDFQTRTKYYRFSTIGMWSPYLLFNKDKLYSFRFDMPLYQQQQLNMSESEFEKYKNNYYISNSSVLIMDVFNTNFGL